MAALVSKGGNANYRREVPGAGNHGVQIATLPWTLGTPKKWSSALRNTASQCLATLCIYGEHLERQNITALTIRLHYPRVLKRFKLDTKLLLTLYCPSVGRLLMHHITVWQLFSGATERSKKKKKEKGSSGSFALFDLLPSGRSFRCIRSRTNRLKNSFFPQGHNRSKLKHVLTLYMSCIGLRCVIFD